MPSWGKCTTSNCSSSATSQHCTNKMLSLNCAIVVILCEILKIRGDHWYSADKREGLGQENFRDNLLNRTQHLKPYRSAVYEHENFRIVSVASNRTSDEDKPLRLNETLKQPDSSNMELTHDYKPVDNRSRKAAHVIKYNNNINLINIVKSVTPKRKLIKRRCPHQRIRHNKKLPSNQTAKTKFLDVFEVVEFQNVACTSSSGLEGTCLHEYECESSGGSPMGTCADGYGTCCVTQFLCDGQSSDPVGWFINPRFPSPSTDRLSCTFTLDKSSEDVIQIRLDFLSFELQPPNAGTCQEDQFVVSGQNMNSIIPILCGINTGQHVYVEVGDIEGPIYLSVQTATSESRLYAMKVTQLTSADDLIAPSGCLQYLTEEQGILESFNYRERTEIGIPRVPSYLNNLNYAICIRRAPATCSVTYSNADYMQIVNYDLDGLPVIPQGQAGVEIFNCPGDWLLIAATRLCGDRLNDGAVLQDFSLDAPITDSNAGPITVWFRTDEGYTGRGFKLQYKQNACNGPQ